MKVPLRPLDIPIIAAGFALTLFSAFAVYGHSRGAARVVIRAQGGAVWTFPLEAEETVAVPGPAGNTVVEIHEGRARVLSSPCGNQTCVSAGYLRSGGEWTACLPNQVFLLIETGGGGEEADALAW